MASVQWLRPGNNFYKLQLLNSQGVGLETLGSVRVEGKEWKAWDSRSGEEKGFRTRPDAMAWVKGKNKDAQAVYDSNLAAPRRLKPGEGKKMYRNPNYYEATGVSGEEFTNFGSFDCAHDAVVYAQGVADSDAYEGVAVLEEVQAGGEKKWWVIADEEELMERGEFEDVDVEENPSLKQQATEYLSRRYDEQCERYPMTRDSVSRSQYIAANLKAAMRNMRTKEKQNPFPFKKCIKRARAKGIDDPNAYCAVVDRRMHQNPSDADTAWQEVVRLERAWRALANANTRRHTTPLREEDREKKIQRAQQRYEHALRAYRAQYGRRENPSLRERASEAYKDIKHAITKSSASKAALKRLREAETKIAPTQKFGLRKKRNPEGDAANLYEEFHGRHSGEVVEVAYEEHEHETLTGLGDLCQLKIITPFKKDCVINVCPTKSPKDLPDPSQLPREDRIILSCSEDGKQLYFIGGDQSVDVEALGFGEDDMKDSMLLGVLYEVTYQAEKGFDKFQLTNYYHKLGEDTGVEPVLTYDPVSCLLKVSGGQYKVEAPGIIN